MERYTDDPCHGLGYQRRVRQRRELDEPDAIRIGPANAFGDRERQPRLADATHPGECEQPRLVQRRGELHQLLVSTDEAGRLQWQIAGPGLARDHIPQPSLAAHPVTREDYGGGRVPNAEATQHHLTRKDGT
jgi:hypothetical protein